MFRLDEAAEVRVRVHQTRSAHRFGKVGRVMLIKVVPSRVTQIQLGLGRCNHGDTDPGIVRQSQRD